MKFKTLICFFIILFSTFFINSETPSYILENAKEQYEKAKEEYQLRNYNNAKRLFKNAWTWFYGEDTDYYQNLAAECSCYLIKTNLSLLWQTVSAEEYSINKEDYIKFLKIKGDYLSEPTIHTEELDEVLKRVDDIFSKRRTSW